MNEQPESHGEPSTVTLEGTYSPPEYFEEPITLTFSDYTATIQEGQIVVVFRESQPLPDSACEAEVLRKVHQAFDARFICTCRPWKMTTLFRYQRYADGRVSTWGTFGVASTFVVGAMDIVLYDAEGNVLQDTKAERLAREHEDRERALRHEQEMKVIRDLKDSAFLKQFMRHAEDPLLQKLQASFKQAIVDTDDQMTHFYEIRDALSTFIDVNNKTYKYLGITRDDWRDFGSITCDRNIQQGRHRGRHSQLRAATKEERQKVCEIARRMIQGYLNHLDRNLS